jgi:2-C-methyl-D-erythritol 2,4-cyclodiphosphate synthase
VALHAIADALLSAIGSGDLGRRFPAGDPATRGIDSRSLLSDVIGDVTAAGWRATGVDLLIRGARPHLGAARLDAMRDVIAGSLGLAPTAVSVHASSGNLDGPEGAGRSISASAIVQLVRR